LNILENVYDRLTGNSFKIIEAVRSDTNYQLLVQTDGSSTLLPIQRASQGTLSVLSMVCLIYKYLQLIIEEAGIKTDRQVNEYHGIVIIDEIDAHLHPNWQQNLVEILKTSFQNVQFIIASHSPLIVAGSKENEVNVLRKAETGFYIQQIKRHFIGVSVEQLYQSIFEIEDKDETFKKYAAMIPLKNKFEEEISKIETKRKLTNKKDIEDYDGLLTKQSRIEDQMNLFKMLRDKRSRSEDEDKMFQSMCSRFSLSPESNENEISEKSRLSRDELVRLQALTNLQQLDSRTKQRLDTLYDHVHYINIVENLTEPEKTQNYQSHV
jgi:predicted ATP-binding protein involved in virulence